MFASNRFWSHDSWVICLELFWWHKCVLVSWNKLSLIVGASISDNDLWWVLIWHDDGWLWQSASESVWMIWLEWFLKHTGMKVLSHLELILGQGSYFAQSLAVEIYWLWSTIGKCEADCLTILLENFTAWSNFGILEHGCWVGDFISVNHSILVQSCLGSCCWGHFFFSLCSYGMFRQWHFIFFYLKILIKSTIIIL